MFKIYGSEMCPDCVACKMNFDTNNVEYEFIDINENLHNLSEFLKHRDVNPVFNRCKEINDIGLPALMREDGSLFLDWEGYLKECGVEVVYPDNNKTACSIDGKGC